MNLWIDGRLSSPYVARIMYDTSNKSRILNFFHVEQTHFYGFSDGIFGSLFQHMCVAEDV